MNTPRQFLIWDNAERGAWHRPGLRGYTCDINEAGRFDEATARRIVDNAGPGPDGIPDTIMMLEPTGRIVLPITVNPDDQRFAFQASTLNVGRLHALPDPEREPSCLLCGCTENRACTTICAWVADPDLVILGLDPMTADLCTACLPARLPTEEEVDAARAYVERVSANWTIHPDGPDPRPAAYLHALNVVMVDVYQVAARAAATREMANAANARLRALLLTALGETDDGRTSLAEYVGALVGQRDQLRGTVRRYATTGAAAIRTVNRVRDTIDRISGELATVHVEQLRQALAEPEPADAGQGNPVHAAAEAALEAVATRLKPYATEPYGDLRMGPKRAALMAVDAAAPILLAAGWSQVRPGPGQEPAPELARWLTRAALNPGSIAGRRRGPSWRPDEEGYAEVQESMADWVQRAIQRVLAKGGQPHCERCCEVIRVDDDAYAPPLPGIGLWEHAGVCPPRVAPNGCDDCSVEPGERHRHAGCPGNLPAIARAGRP